VKKDFGNDKCSTVINEKFIRDKFDKECFGKKECSFIFKEEGFMKEKIGSNDNCAHLLANFFIQYTCEVNDDLLEVKYNQIAKATAIIMFVAFSFIMLIWYMQTTSKLQKAAYDMNTITAGDFTVEYDISAEIYDYFLKEKFDKDEATKGEAPAFQLKHLLKEEVAAILSHALKEKYE
jgi:hypothetical protein